MTGWLQELVKKLKSVENKRILPGNTLWLQLVKRQWESGWMCYSLAQRATRSSKTWSDLSRPGVIFQDLDWSFKTAPYFPRMVTKKSIKTWSYLPTLLHDVIKGLLDQDLQDLKWSSTKFFERKPGEVPRPWRMLQGIPRRDLLVKELLKIGFWSPNEDLSKDFQWIVS